MWRGREDASGDVMVAGLTTHNVSTMEVRPPTIWLALPRRILMLLLLMVVVMTWQEVSDLLYRGALCRATASTNMNAHSSRHVQGDSSATDGHHFASLSGLMSVAPTAQVPRHLHAVLGGVVRGRPTGTSHHPLPYIRPLMHGWIMAYAPPDHRHDHQPFTGVLSFQVPPRGPRRIRAGQAHRYDEPLTHMSHRRSLTRQ